MVHESGAIDQACRVLNLKGGYGRTRLRRLPLQKSLARKPRSGDDPLAQIVSSAAGRWRRREHRYDRTWTVTVRWRGRSSKSMSTTCCQVPSASRPSMTGIVSDGPITAARRCACALLSWLRMLCS